MSEIKQITEKIKKFRDDRDWKQFHNPKDGAISLALEAAEVLEHFQWRDKEGVEAYVKTHKKEIGEEIADVLYWVLLMSHDLNIDILDALKKKMKKNIKKYPIKKAKGNIKKYTEL